MKNSYLKKLSDSFIKNRKAFICIGLLIAIYIYHCFYWYGYIIDDSYITFRYVSNFCRGLGLVYNPGEHVEGYSNFSWLILLTPGVKLGFDPVIFSRILGIISGVGAIICTYLICSAVIPQSIFVFLPSLLLATNSFFCFWSFSGMETVFFSFLLTLSAVLYLRSSNKSRILLAFVLGVLCLSRPEGVGYAVIFSAMETVKNRHAQLKEHLKFYGIILSIFFLHLSFKQFYYGSLLPNTYYGKVIFPFKAESYKYILNFYFHRGILLAFMFILSMTYAMRKRRIRPMILPLLFSWFYIAYVRMDWMPNYRYHVHTLPIVFSLMSVGFYMLFAEFYKKKSCFFIIMLLVGAHIAININIDIESCYWGGYHLEKPARWLENIPNNVKSGMWSSLIEETMFLVENTDENMTVGMHNIGLPGFVSNCRVYDQAMIVNKDAYRGFRALRDPCWKVTLSYIFGRMKKNLEYYNPDFFIYPSFFKNSPEKTPERRYMELMYTEYFDSRMSLVKKVDKGHSYFMYYKKKGLKRKFSNNELIEKYKKIVQKYPYTAFKERLEELLTLGP